MSDILNVPELFGSDVFNEATMKQRLPEEVFTAWKTCVLTGSIYRMEDLRSDRKPAAFGCGK